MKRWTMALFTAAICVVSCSKNYGTDVREVAPKVETVIFSADGKSVKYGIDAEWSDKPATFTVTLSKNIPWNVESTKPQWVHITKTEKTFTFTADPIDLVEPKAATVWVQAGGTSIHQIVVSQQAALSVSPLGDIVFPLKGADKTYTVTTSRNQAWNVISNQSWLTVRKNATAGTFTLSAAANTGTTAPPPATVTVTSGKATPITINAEQVAPELSVRMRYDSFTTLSVSSMTFNAFGNAVIINNEKAYMPSEMFFIYSTNTEPVNVTSNYSWLKANQTSKIIGNNLVPGFTVSVEPLSLSGQPGQIVVSKRSGTVTVTAGNAPPVTIAVSQLAQSVISIN
ncbi:MAG: BACON domain-containing protein [Bacteroidales bacterium]|jgi:hypothetical protein|nr:BACON domain-containing protein [Bacteroidales bacterium]